MLPTYGTPFRNASDALKWQVHTRKQAIVPQYANPYYAPAGCPHNQHSGGNVGGGQSAPCCGAAPRYAPGQAGKGAR